jgi:hypothetical protein
MLQRSIIAALVLVGAASATLPAAFSELDHYPDWSGQWSRGTPGASWDPTKPPGLKQEAPLTPQYQAIYETNLEAVKFGDEGYNAHSRCIPAGMPRMMLAYEPLELIITPQTTYIRDYFNEFRRIYTDARTWPAHITPTFNGYSIGQWHDEDGAGRYDTLTIETRSLRGPRVFDATGIPFHEDNRTIIRERMYLDKANRDVLRDEITTFDDALTRPWTVTRSYNREHVPLWPEFLCAEDNHHLVIGKESYFLNVDGNLMPTRKNQPPPDLRNFGQPRR